MPAKATMPIRGMEDLSWRDWVLFNKQQTGYYRVMYDETNYNLLTEQLNSEAYDVIHVQNRAQLIDDLYEFVKVGDIRVKVFMNLVTYLKRETEYTAWVPAARAFNELDKILDGAEFHRAFHAYLAELSMKFYESTGIEDQPNDEYLKKQARIVAADFACHFGVKECLEATQEQLVKALAGNTVHPNARQIIFTNGARTATDEQLERLWKHMITSATSDERDVIVTSFALVGNSTSRIKYMQRALQSTDDTLTAANRFALFSKAYRSGRDGLNTCINILQENATAVFSTFVDKPVDAIIRDMAVNVFDDINNIEVREFIRRSHRIDSFVNNF